jgi:hypothetical protein
MSGGGVKGPWNKWEGPTAVPCCGRAPVYAAKALDPASLPTLPVAGVGWLLTRPICLTASAGVWGQRPQGNYSHLRARPQAKY